MKAQPILPLVSSTTTTLKNLDRSQLMALAWMAFFCTVYSIGASISCGSLFIDLTSTEFEKKINEVAPTRVNPFESRTERLMRESNEQRPDESDDDYHKRRDEILAEISAIKTKQVKDEWQAAVEKSGHSYLLPGETREEAKQRFQEMKIMNKLDNPLVGRRKLAMKEEHDKPAAMNTAENTNSDVGSMQDRITEQTSSSDGRTDDSASMHQVEDEGLEPEVGKPEGDQ